jgi:outer membrane protein OmpA-like peptidoglycan-associated protein/tetratricopeptide (TPR) repeat protein
MKNNVLFYITIICVFSVNIYSQKAKVAAADKKYNNYAYVDAIKTYERVAEKGYKSADMFQKIGNAYYFNGELEKAAQWYTELFAFTSEVEPAYYYRYAQSLRSIGENDKATKIMEKFEKMSGNDSRGELFAKNKNYLDVIKANSGRYKIEDAGINSPYSDYGTTLSSDKLFFASARDTGSLAHRRHSWTDQSFTKLYVSNVGEELSLGIPTKFDKAIDSKFNESTPIFTKDGNTIYFTRNNYLAGKKGKDGNKSTLVKIYKATLENKKWININELPFDSDNYSTAHPILSPDEKTMYFVSDMPGTIGLSDLFKVQINDDGSFGTPINLGRQINTEGRETFPFVTDDNEIYFASDGHPGLGGLDIFVAKIKTDGTFGKIQNIGMDANSPKDDFAYWIDTKSRRGFLSSNRDGGQGYDDIYKFLETRKLICEQQLYGKVNDLFTSEIISGAKISLFDNNFNPLVTVDSDDKGQYAFSVECGKIYNVRAEKEDYTTKEESVTIAVQDGKTMLDMTLEKVKCKVTIGDDLGKCFGIRNIYFDFDKSNIRVEAAIDLEKILDVLNQYPKMKLDIRSHTDSRGSFKYNEALSERRAQATISWLIQNGVPKNRLTAKGYGESQLINKCADAVQCSEEDHQLNRRSEFIIMEL